MGLNIGCGLYAGPGPYTGVVGLTNVLPEGYGMLYGVGYGIGDTTEGGKG